MTHESLQLLMTFDIHHMLDVKKTKKKKLKRKKSEFNNSCAFEEAR